MADSIEAEAIGDCFRAAPPRYGNLALQSIDRTLLLSPTLSTPFLNRVVGLGNGGAVSQAMLEEIMALYRERGIANYWIQVSPLARHLLPLLEKNGFQPAANKGIEQFLLDQSIPFAGTLQVREVTAQESGLLGMVLCRSFSFPESMQEWFAAMAMRKGWRFYFACHDGVPIAVGGLYLSGTRAWLGMGGTLPEARRLGAQAALIAARVLAAQQAGCRDIGVGTWHPKEGENNSSLNNILRAGFRRVALRLNYGLVTA
ncbi:GNAT family N-acetyltransferase [Janthinobacterium agaricidamnosum]|uniref:GNAT family N-acetyltransferase n=1 Tax=Janthinobacterium agaricidamnosum TaxID=55508 RepID=UPI00142F3807|nr:GNAT family N-acetyltransferase [Janthinobacterium agaricidamnosum]